MGKRAAIYCRVSTAEQSSDMQLDDLRDLANRRDWKVANEYVDEGISGTKLSRPQLDRLMADARRRKFDVVVVWRFDRFARSTVHLLAALEEFRSLGVDFVSHQEAIDTTTPLGKMVFTVVASVAELERSIIVERVHAGIRRARMLGKRIGQPSVTVDVVRVLKLRKSGMTLRQIAAETGTSRTKILKVLNGAVTKPLRKSVL